MFEAVYTFTEAREQLYALPLAMVLWVRWLGLVNLVGPLFFLRRPQARWVLAAMLFVMITNTSMMYFGGSGLVKALSIPHLIVWVPLVVYLANQFRTGKVEIGSAFGIWLFAVMVTNFVSSVFDFRDGAEYLLGDRGVVTLDPTAAPPYVTLSAMAVLGVVMLAYAFGPGRTRPVT
jgi:hypothetical protein